MKEFEKKVLNTINKYKMFSKGDTVCVGLSGGADSVSLLWVLNALKNILGINIVAAHVNHGIREEASHDADFCRRLCESIGVPFFLKEVKIKELAKENGVGEEEMGRSVRYSFFRELAGPNGKIATAHNKNDNVETLLMRVIRGTGLNGLSSIKHVNGNIVRPILDIDRTSIEEYVKGCGLSYVTDSTNLQTVYTRNKIRLDVIPYIRENINPNVIESISSNIKTYTEDGDCLNKIAKEAFVRAVSKEDGVYIVNKKEFKNLHIAIQKRIIMRIVEKFSRDTMNFSSDNIEKVIELFYKENGKQFYANSVTFISSNDSVICYVDKHNAKKYDYSFNLVDMTEEIVNNESVCYVPVTDEVFGNVEVRKRKDGDVVRIDDEKHKKLNDLLRDKKIPQSLRDDIDVISVCGEIVMIPGVFSTRYKNRKGLFLKIMALERGYFEKV